MPAIKTWLDQATKKLAAVGIDTPQLDAELILAYTLHKNRTYLHAHPEQMLDAEQLKIADFSLDLRLNRMPIAYITTNKEFYGRNFMVIPEAVLIPRPESEDIINSLKQILPIRLRRLPSKVSKLIGLGSIDEINLFDVGTGSGCLGITAKLEFPDLNVTLIDISNVALQIAAINAKSLLAGVSIIQGDLLENYHERPNIIIANLPYVDKSWERSPETEFEPKLALFAGDKGQALIKKLIRQSDNIMTSGGYLIIEADPSQHDSLIEYAKKHSFTFANKLGYVITFSKRISDESRSK